MVTNGAPCLHQGRRADERLPVCSSAKVLVSAQPADPGRSLSQGSWTELLHLLQLQTGFVGRCCWISGSVVSVQAKHVTFDLLVRSRVRSDGSLDESQQVSEVFDK